MWQIKLETWNLKCQPTCCSSLNTLSHLEIHRITEVKWTVNVVSFDYKSYETLFPVHPAHTPFCVSLVEQTSVAMVNVSLELTDRPPTLLELRISVDPLWLSEWLRSDGRDRYELTSSMRLLSPYRKKENTCSPYLFENVWINWLVSLSYTMLSDIKVYLHVL